MNKRGGSYLIHNIVFIQITLLVFSTIAISFFISQIDIVVAQRTDPRLTTTPPNPQTSASTGQLSLQPKWNMFEGTGTSATQSSGGNLGKSLTENLGGNTPLTDIPFGGADPTKLTK